MALYQFAEKTAAKPWLATQPGVDRTPPALPSSHTMPTTTARLTQWISAPPTYAGCSRSRSDIQIANSLRFFEDLLLEDDRLQAESLSLSTD